MDGLILLILALLAFVVLLGLIILLWLEYRANKLSDEFEDTECNAEEQQREEEE